MNNDSASNCKTNKNYIQRTLKWASPLAYAAAIPEEEKHWSLLYSGLKTEISGRFSILARFPMDEIQSEDFHALEEKLSDAHATFENAWFGYLGYGLKNSLETLPEDTDANIPLPNLWMVRFGLILWFDHEKREVHAFASDEALFEQLEEPLTQPLSPKVEINNLSSNMSKTEYLSHVGEIKEAITRGDLYQANLTRKFSGNFSCDAPYSALFALLCDISPAPYSCLMKLEDNYILSSSPERFLHINNHGDISASPIKGSARRAANPEEDATIREALQFSEKDRAENLMIVDLTRNDLARSCVVGSVEVELLFGMHSYATVHHMFSTIVGKKQPEKTALDVVKCAFPPGSMTGTPKIKAMELCSKLEKQARGVYSGAIGWFGGDGSADLSVVIRTLILKGDQFEFQVGGAIVADSEAEKEWEETLLKAKGIARTLGIKDETLKNL
jgi:para-aminobenzoate synthetase component 1